MSDELKRCPFCGGDANAQPQTQHLPGCYFDALAQLKAAPRGDLSMVPEVLLAWNRRHDDKRVAELEAENERLREEAHKDGILRVHYGKEIDALKAELAEAVGLIRRSLGYEKLGPLSRDMEDFLSRHGDKSNGNQVAATLQAAPVNGIDG